MILATIVDASRAPLRIRVADTWPRRVRGLLGRASPKAGEGLLITRCKSVHTLGMAYPIDIVYLDRDWRIVGVVHSVRPGCFRVATPPRRSGVTQVLELGDREAARLGLQTGMRLQSHGFSELFGTIVQEAAKHPDSDMHDSSCSVTTK